MKSKWVQQGISIVYTVLASILLGVIGFLGRESLLVVSIMLSKNIYMPRAIDKVYLIIFGVVWLIGWFTFYWYISDGIAKNNLHLRFLRVLGWELIALFAFSLPAAWYTSQGINAPSVVALVLALIAGVVLVRMSKRKLTMPLRA